MELKQVIVVRKDLELGKGKLAAQVAHAAVSAAENSSFRREWIEEMQKKTVLKCNTLEELMQIYESAKKEGLPVALVRDAGLTQIPEGTITCIGIGPAPAGRIDKITGKLKLL